MIQVGTPSPARTCRWLTTGCPRHCPDFLGGTSRNYIFPTPSGVFQVGSPGAADRPVLGCPGRWGTVLSDRQSHEGSWQSGSTRLTVVLPGSRRTGDRSVFPPREARMTKRKTLLTAGLALSLGGLVAALAARGREAAPAPETREAPPRGASSRRPQVAVYPNNALAASVASVPGQPRRL